MARHLTLEGGAQAPLGAMNAETKLLPPYGGRWVETIPDTGPYGLGGPGLFVSVRVPGGEQFKLRSFAYAFVASAGEGRPAGRVLQGPEDAAVLTRARRWFLSLTTEGRGQFVATDEAVRVAVLMFPSFQSDWTPVVAQWVDLASRRHLIAVDHYSSAPFFVACGPTTYLRLKASEKAVAFAIQPKGWDHVSGNCAGAAPAPPSADDDDRPRPRFHSLIRATNG